MQFPRMNNGSFPNIDNVNVNQWVNDFDYSRYDYTQMKITLCAVPWDMGEAHVGNRTISGIGNVVYFGSAEKRDEWFANIPDDECLRFETKYKELHRDKFIDVPVPFDIAAKYNYIAVEYELFANDASPVEYENNSGVRKWFWFVREVEFLAPNTTRLHLLDDAFQTWIYDVDISGMVLERGHAPMFEVTADEYLNNPIENAAGLLTPDVNYGSDIIARNSHEFIINDGNMYALVVTTSNPYDGFWGSKTNDNWVTPGKLFSNVQSIPGYYAFALKAENFDDFIFGVNSYYPQFVQTVKAIAFVSDKLLTRGNYFTFANVTCYEVDANYTQNDLIDIEKSDFEYPEKYANIAKLYTYPYSYILLTDENGNETEIHIENTNGHIKVESSLNLVFPWLSVNAHISGIGKSARKNITFRNIDSRNMPIQGNWFETLKTWNIPTFGVYQDAWLNNDYATHYDREQQALAVANQYANVVETAGALTANALLAASANTAATTRSNTMLYLTHAQQVSYNNSIRDADNTASADGVTATTTAAEQQAALAASCGVASGAVGAIGSAATGNVAGAVSSLANALVGGYSTMASTSIGVALTQAQLSVTQSSNNAHTFWANDFDDHKVTATQNTQTDLATYHNNLTTGTAANSAAAQIANGARDQATGNAAITNQIAQAALNAPMEFGAWNSGDTAATRAQGWFANVVTQTDSAIAAAGDEFLRYGYEYERQWAFDGNWNIGKYFTYWKLKDFWVSNLNVPDMYMDKLRFFLFGGVTVWHDPADIGKVTIYDNI